jgi:hypothetical protein
VSFLFAEFIEGHGMFLHDLRIGFVIPQQSPPGLEPSMVLTAFDVGESATDFDLIIVDGRIARTSVLTSRRQH